MKCHYVIPYVNPDTDGVCSAIAYAEYLTKRSGSLVQPIVFGLLDAETEFVLKHTRTKTPSDVSEFQPTDRICLVDTHQVRQLPPNLPLDAVTEILDHHPVGDPEAFPNATITNEPIGSVATLVAEKHQKAGIIPDPRISSLLYSAIVSNTLNFQAPTTTDRDVASAEWALQLADLPSTYVDLMFAARSDLGARTTLEILESDYKEFDFAEVRFGMTQLETMDLDSFLCRKDLVTCLDTLAKENELDHILFNGVDIGKRVSVLVASKEETREMLNAAIGAEFVGSMAHFDRVLLRKSDLIPQCKAYFE